MHGIPFPALSPEIFSISLFGMTFALRWYALAYIVGVLIAWRLILKAISKPQLWRASGPAMNADQLDRLLTWLIIGIILGGRLGFVLFYQPAWYLAHPGDILKVWEGGMSFHGGFLGVVAAAWIFFKREGIALASGADLLALATPPGLFLGRISNFINAELWGRQTEMPWGVIFPGQAAQDCGSVVAELCARHPSQLYEAALEGLLLGIVLLWLVWRRGALKTPGLVTGVFLAGYGGARFLVEFFRQPDAQFVSIDNPLGLAFHVSGYGLTMGQMLSLPMIIIGLWLIGHAKAAREKTRA